MARRSLFRMLYLASLNVLCMWPALVAAQEGPIRVQIETAPAGANVFVDDRSAGIQCQSGALCRLKLKRGPHRLILELEGYRTQEQVIAVSGSQRFSFKLLSAPASLDVRVPATNPAAQGAELFLDGKLKGVVPSVLEVGEGKHLVEVRRSGFEPYAEQVDLKAGEQRPMFVSLAIPSPVPRIVPPPIERPPAPIIVQMPPAAAPLPPPPPMGDPTVPVAIVPENPKFTYIASLGQGQTCSTPCTVYALPGSTTISVSGPGSKFFQESITIPNAPSQIAVRHFTLSRAISGPILLVLGTGALAGGSLWLNAALSYPSVSSFSVGLAAFSVLHGVAFTLAGIGELARIKTNRAEVRYGSH